MLKILNKTFLITLLVTSIFLTGCESLPEASDPLSRASSLSNVNAEEGDKLRPTENFDYNALFSNNNTAFTMSETKRGTNFSPNANAKEVDEFLPKENFHLDKIFTSYKTESNSGQASATKSIASTKIPSTNSTNPSPSSLDNFFGALITSESNSGQASATKSIASTKIPSTNSTNPSPSSLDNFFGALIATESIDDANIFFDYEAEQERLRRVKIIKENTITTQKNNVIANQIRNKDLDEQLIVDLTNLEKNIPINKEKLAQSIKKELKHKVRLLDAETALEVAEFNMLASARSNNVVSRVEDRVLSATSGMRNDLIRKMLSSEPENYYQLKEQGKQLEAVYQVDIARAKLKYQKQIDVLEGDVKSLRVANKRIINNRLSEMEEQRIAEALTIEEKIKTKNQKVVDQSYPTFEEKILEYTNIFKSKLAQREKSVLDRLNSEYANAKFARESARNLENRQYIADINQQIEREQTSYKDKSTVSLYASRDAKINSITNNLKRSIKRVKSNGTQALADLKSKNAREHQKQKSALHAPYNKKRQALNQKYQQAKSKILSRFRSEEYAVVAKIRKETGVANREIDARVKAEIKASLDSFEALQKEEAANKIKEEAAKKAIEIEKLKKSKESPGFFKSLF